MATDRPGIQLLLLFNRVNWFATARPDNRYNGPIGPTRKGSWRVRGRGDFLSTRFPTHKFRRERSGERGSPVAGQSSDGRWVLEVGSNILYLNSSNGCRVGRCELHPTVACLFPSHLRSSCWRVSASFCAPRPSAWMPPGAQRRNKIYPIQQLPLWPT